MDANKLKKLKEVKFEIHPACGLCVNGNFANSFVDFGTCNVHSYDHQKHSESHRQMNIFRYGKCHTGDFKITEQALNWIGTYAEFFK